VCPRTCNKIADAFASFGCKLSSDMPITWESVLQFVEDLMTSDSTVSDE
jgi:hypothetical protein